MADQYTHVRMFADHHRAVENALGEYPSQYTRCLEWQPVALTVGVAEAEDTCCPRCLSADPGLVARYNDPGYVLDDEHPLLDLRHQRQTP